MYVYAFMNETHLKNWLKVSFDFGQIFHVKLNPGLRGHCMQVRELLIKSKNTQYPHFRRDKDRFNLSRIYPQEFIASCFKAL